MELALDAVVAQLMIMKDLTRQNGGFSDELILPEDIWWGNPGTLADQQYPYVYVEPVLSVPKSETTRDKTRTETIRIVVLADPRPFYDVTEVSEATASREIVRTMEVIERWFEKTSLRIPNGLLPGSTDLVVTSTEYANQLRGQLYSLGASVVLSVDVRHLKT